MSEEQEDMIKNDQADLKICQIELLEMNNKITEMKGYWNLVRVKKMQSKWQSCTIFNPYHVGKYWE